MTGALGLVGAAAVRRLTAMGLEVVGIDNDMRRTFFGDAASNAATHDALKQCKGFRLVEADIRDTDGITKVFRRHLGAVQAVIHAAAQPSHDWAATDPTTDFAINATATLALLEACREHTPDARFLCVSTNKVYGDHPNHLPLAEGATRMDLDPSHPFHDRGIDESMSIDQTRHSLFGVSKTAADLMVQEYGDRFGLATSVFRAGCITGEDHHGAKAHGFLSYLCRVAREGGTYEVIGHDGKQVRDNLHADDLADAFARVIAAPPSSGVYNIGGGRKASCSILEALDIASEILARPVSRTFTKAPRYGDHIWWISDTSRFQNTYPGWSPSHTAKDLITRLLADV
ncbi:MAG: NAD-dependent epimerase/dehydratase family protein [Pseudomonadota bacterium]